MNNLRQDNLVIPQGTTWAIRWELTAPGGIPLDTTGWRVRSQVRRRTTAPDILHEWSTEIGNATVIDSYVELRVAPEVSSAWTWGKAPMVFDVEVINSKNEVMRITQGTVTLSEEVTR